jgi:hypothetical protein
MTQVHVERRWSTQSVRVWVRIGNGKLLTIPGPGLLEEVEVEPGGITEEGYLMELPEHVFAAIVAAGAEVLPPDRAMAAHLADATTVRDRLLSIFEKGTV